MRSSFDIVKIYCEIFEERITNISRFILKEKKNRKIDISVKKLFSSLNGQAFIIAIFRAKSENFSDLTAFAIPLACLYT